MASIGPQLPPRLQKRKRTPEDNDQPSSPPAKATRRDNDDEVDLNDSDSDSDDGYGPSLPRSKPSIGPSLPSSNLSPQLKSTERPVTKLSIGPSLPPAPSTNQDEIALEDSDSSYGPRSPPASNTAAATSGLPPKRILGPAPPPADLSQRPLTDPDSDSDSEDEWGPSLPGAAPSKPTSTSSHGPSLPSAPALPKRDDWMIAPPTSSGYRAPDPTKLKNRKFASGPRAATEVKSGGVSSIWTETPEEKARRLANAVLGREDPNNPSTPAAGSSSSNSKKRSKYSAEDEAQIRAYTEQTRGKSLVEQHQERKAEAKKQRGGEFKPGEEDDDPSKRVFDWEKDMKVGGNISGSQKKQILNKAANFGGRFQKGSYL